MAKEYAGSEHDKALQISAQRKAKEIALEYSIKESYSLQEKEALEKSLLKLSSQFSLNEGDMREIALLRRDYGVPTTALNSLLEKGRLVTDIRLLYEARENNQQVRVGKKQRREILSLVSMSDLWDAMYGGPIDEVLLADAISALANADSERYLNSRIKEVITMTQVHGHSLEQTLDSLETRQAFSDENYESAEYFSEHREL